MKPILQQLHAGNVFSQSEAEAVLDFILETEDVASEQIAAFLMAISMRGETANELAGFLQSIRKRAIKIPSKPNELIFDNCGTGGGGPSTFNISTAAALVMAAGGIKMAKHGNRSATGRCGSADVAEALNLPLHPSPALAACSLEQSPFSFLFAPYFHPGLAKLAPIRRSLGVRTCFNLLGPLANPVAVSRQIVGVAHPQHLDLLARVLQRDSIHSAYIVCGEDQMDEFSLSAPTHVRHLQNGVIQSFTVRPKDFGLKECDVRELVGGNAQANAGIITDILAGRDQSARRDIVAMNASAGFVLAGIEPTFLSGTERALDVIASQKAFDLLENLQNHGAIS